jgi:uncharacterized protein with HEPN domain
VSADGPVRPDRHALLETAALLERAEQLAVAGGRSRYDSDDIYRWALHRLWIAIGNEALAYCAVSGLDVYRAVPWARLYQLRCRLAHNRLPDVDEDAVWRMTQLRAGPLRTQVRAIIR